MESRDKTFRKSIGPPFGQRLLALRANTDVCPSVVPVLVCGFPISLILRRVERKSPLGHSDGGIHRKQDL